MTDQGWCDWCAEWRTIAHRAPEQEGWGERARVVQQITYNCGHTFRGPLTSTIQENRQ